jgi:hypothetical protein
MIPYRKRRPVEGVDALTPHPFNAEIADVVSVLHHIDRDNVNLHDLTPAKCRLGAWGNFAWGARTAEKTVHIDGQDANQQMFPVPNHSGTPWIKDFVSQDGWLEVKFGGMYKLDNGTAVLPDLWFGVTVDGVVIGKSPWTQGDDDEDEIAVIHRSFDVCCSTPVGAGTRRVAFVFGIWSPITTGTSVDADIIFKAGNYSIKEYRR